MARMNGKAKNGLKKGIKKAKAGAKKPAAKNGKNGKKLTAKQKTLPKFLQDKIMKRG